MSRIQMDTWRIVQLVAVSIALAAGCSWFDSGSGTPDAESTPAGTPVVQVPVPELFVDPEAEPDEGRAPLTVQFDANVEDNLGPVVECEWDLGDGSAKVKGLKPSHVYEKPGDYEVQVTCRDSEGLIGESEVDVFVNPG
jgi:PKD repeat protein